MKKSLAFSLFLGLIFAVSCKVIQKDHNTVIIWVNSATVDCTGVAPMQCLQVQFNEVLAANNWHYFYDKIEGFEYQPGFVYKLQVEKTELDAKDVPADASTMKYKLIEVLSKEADKRLRTHDIWALKTIGDEDYNSSTTNKHPTLEINTTEMRMNGNDGCNNIFGGIEILTDKELKFAMLAGTRMACPDMEVSNEFNAALAETTSYIIKNSTLHLFNAKGDELITFKKVD